MTKTFLLRSRCIIGKMKSAIFVIIPIFNEAPVISQVIEELKACGFSHILVIDDGSSDNSFEKAQSAGALAISHSMNRGKGAAIKTGMEAAKLFGAHIVVTFDGDGQHDPKDIKKLIWYVNKGYDVVLGSRFLSLQNVPLYKRIFNYCANVMTYILYGIWVNDSQSGLRAYSNKALSCIDMTSDRYEFDTEVLREIHRYDLRYKEVPIRVRYTRYSQQKKNRQSISSAILTMIKLVLSS